jgi:hypothetical protein
MCDYSLAIPNRLAASGKELIVHRFEAGSVGLASALELRRYKSVVRPNVTGSGPRSKPFLFRRKLDRSLQYASHPVPGC